MSTSYSIGAAAANNVAAMSPAGQIYLFNGSTWISLPKEPGGAAEVAVALGSVWCRDEAGFLHRFDAGTQNWIKDANAKWVASISADSSGRLWVINWYGEVSYMATLGSWTSIPRLPAENWTYTVNWGDTLADIVRAQYGITDRRGIDAKVREIVTLNKPNYPRITKDYIQAGWVLRMPPR